jgi:hypothetical protein
MSNVSGKLLPVGTRFVNVWQLNSSNRPNANSATVSYTGSQAQGGKQMTLTVPEPRKITHAGDDRPLAIDFLPALEASHAELHVAKTDYTLQAILAGVKASTIGESVGMLYQTDQQGFEPTVGLHVYQQALDASGTPGVSGARRWRSIWVPKCRMILMPHGTDDNAADLIYRVAPFISEAHLWGTSFTALLDGAIESQFSERMTEGIPFLDTFLGDNAHATFTLTHTALSAAKIAVFENGVLKANPGDYTVVLGPPTVLTRVAGNLGTGVDWDVLYEY